MVKNIAGAKKREKMAEKGREVWRLGSGDWSLGNPQNSRLQSPDF
jgi:hypothetical protein